MTQTTFIHPNEIRAQFATAMSDLYRIEVPLYGELLDLVQQVNQQVLNDNPEWLHQADQSGTLQRLSAERHGAIRLGTAEELFTMRRLFAVMGMQPVGYYDLTEAGLPVHSTAFRPLAIDDLNASPFRIFTSLLRLDLIDNRALREQAETLLSQRKIFTTGLLELVELNKANAGLTPQQAEQFVVEALETFRWHSQATVDLDTYQQFLDTHRLIADIVCFIGPHINHLTPRTLDIDQVQQQMSKRGMQAKAIVEGPPKRKNPILLRQTSFKALSESIDFIDSSGSTTAGTHTARFGEIEQRGMALTPKGRRLYDQLLTQARSQVTDSVENPENYNRQLTQAFTSFPDDLNQLHSQGLAYFRYRVNKHDKSSELDALEQLIENAVLELIPITYEDFLPISAAGIFQSNLDDRQSQSFERSPNQQLFEQQLGCVVTSEFEFYHRIQRESLLEAVEVVYQSGIDSKKFMHQFDEKYPL